MYNEDVSIDFSANVAPFSASLTQAIKQLETFGASADGTTGKLSKLNSATLALSKLVGRFVDLNKTSTASAAAYQQKLSGLATTTALNEKQFKGLSDVALKFGREFPIGLDKSIGLVNTLQTSGVTTTKSIKELGNAFIKIQAASGEFGGQFVADMLSVNRSFGNSMSSASKFGDSIVSVSNKFGASAGSVVGFTKALAPFASAMGINETSTIGLSTAFSRLGEDGMRSANALNKVMLDLTKSVKTGSPEVRQYAAVMNMTTESLTQLVNTDPAEAVIRFTEAINKQGPKAMNTLNQLGIDGIQTFKSLQALGKSTDLRDILNTSRESYGNGSAVEGAKVALGGVNDQMSRLGEGMQQTIAVAGTPFLDIIEKMLSLMNGVAEAVHKVTSALSKAAQTIAPLLVAVKVILASFQAIAAIQFARFLGNAFQNNTQMGQSFKIGRDAAAIGQSYGAAGNFMSRMGERYENNMSGIMGRSLRENAGLAYQGLKGAVGYGMAGYMNMTSNILRSDSSEAARSQLNSRNFAANFQAAKAGEILTSAAGRKGIEETNASRAKQGLPPIPASQSGQDPMGNLKAFGAAFKQFGKDIQAAGTAAKVSAGIQTTAAGEVGAAMKGLAAMTMKATVEVAKLGLKALGAGAMMIGQQLGVMLAISGVIAAATSIKGGFDKSNKLRDEAMGADLGSSYNDFAEKAGLATVSINNLSSAAREAARSLIMHNKTLDDANNLTAEEINAAKNPNYKSAKDFGKDRSVKDLTNAVLNLQGNSPDAQARAQLLMDITNQYGAGTAMLVSGNLTNQTGFGSTEEKATNEDVYSAGLQDYTRNKSTRWYGGRSETDESKASFVNLRTNLAQNIDNVAGIYGQKAGNAASVIESEKLLKAAKETGNSEQFDAAQRVVNTQLGIKLTGGIDSFKSLTDSLKQKSSSAEETANRQSILGSVAGVDLSNPNYGKLYNANDKPQNVKDMEAADEAFKKINKSATGLSGVFFEATQIALNSGANLGDISVGGKRSDIYANLNTTQKASVDLANKPNDPVALNTKALETLAEALKQNGGDMVAAMKQVAAASDTAASGTTEKNIGETAYAMAQQKQKVADAGLGFLTRNKRDVQIGMEAQQRGPGDTAESKARYDSEIAIADQSQAQLLGMIKQFAEAKRDLDIQMLNQQEDYNTSVLRSNRDFNLQVSYQQADYDKSVKRANAERKLQLERQSQDYAKTAYDPFTRISAVRTTDASGLISNLQGQNATMQKHKDNLIKLKKLGLSNRAINLLGLFDPAKAQEVERLVGDYTRDKSLIAQTNAAVTVREGLATDAINNPENDTYARNTADFNRNMANSETDFKTSLARAVAAHKTSLLDMAANLKIARKRAFDSLAMFGKEIDVTAANAEEILNGIFDGMPAAAKTKMAATIAALKDALAKYKPDAIVIPSYIASPSTEQLREQSELHAKAGVTIAANAKVTAVDGVTGVDDKGNFAWFNKGKWHVYQGMGFQWEQWTQNLKNGSKKPEDVPVKWWTDYSKTAVKIYNAAGDQYKFADGGIVRGPGNGNSDSINARLSNGEYVVRADAVRKYGQSFLDNVNAQKLANASYVNGVDSKMSSMQGYSTNVNNSTTTQNDHSTQINGQITVQAQDPNEFMRKMQAKQRRQRLIQPVGN